MTQLILELKDGGKIDIPLSSVLLLEEGDEKTVNIVYTLDGQTNQSDQIADNYGFVKKKLTDGMFPRPLEVTKQIEKEKHRLFISENYIIARRDLVDKEQPSKMRLTLNINGPIFGVDVLETRKQLDGED